MTEPRALGAGKAADRRSLGPEGPEEAPPDLSVQARGPYTAWGQGRCSLLSLLLLECCVSGLTRTIPYVPPLLLGQSTFCLAVSLEGREGGKMTEITLRPCGTKKHLLDRKDFVKRQGYVRRRWLTPLIWKAEAGGSP